MAFKPLIGGIVLFFFGLTSVIPPFAYSQDIPNFPAKILSLTPVFHPVLIKGMRIHPENPLQFDFIIDTGDTSTDIQAAAFKQEVTRLIKYFLASLTVPEKEMWVNLSPYEKNRIIAPGLGQTQLGSDMLAQDYILKQLTASLIYPDSITGKFFWKKVYAKAQEVFGTTNVPVNTFNKVWIVPDKAVVYVRGNAAYVVESHLKVMLEEDYLAMKKQGARTAPTVSSNIVRQIILPELEKEVNGGGNFANLRQIYNAMILAVWFKVNFQKSLLGKVYDNKNKTKGVDAQDKAFKRRIYAQYIESFKKGIFNLIREESGPDNKIIPRKYFSGGLVGLDAAMLHEMSGPIEPPGVLKIDGRRIEVDAAMLREGSGVKLLAHEAPSIVVAHTKAGFSNHIINGLVPTHIAIRKLEKSKLEGSKLRGSVDHIVAFPKEKGVGAYWNISSEQGDFREELMGASAVKSGNFTGVDLELALEMKDSPEIVIDINEINLRDILGIRAILLWDQYLPAMEKEVKNFISPEFREELKEFIGMEPFEAPHIFPKFYLERQADGSHRIQVTKTAFDGQNHYQAQYTIPPGFKVEFVRGNDGSVKSIKIEGKGKLTLGVRAMTDFKPLTQLPIDEIFNAQALERMKIDPAFRKKAEYFSLLFYKEKVLAGSWLYLSYFGRDTIQGSALMWSSLSLKAKKMIVRSVLDRISDDGTVAVSDEDLGERDFQLNVLLEFTYLPPEEKTPERQEQMIRQVFENEKKGTLKYSVLDSTFLFSGILKFLFEEMDEGQLREFLNEENSRKERNIVTILRHSNRLLGLTDPYTQAIHKLRAKYPDLENLIESPEFRSPDFRADGFKKGQAQDLLETIKLVLKKDIEEAGYDFPGGTDAVTVLNHLIKDAKFGEILDGEFRRKFPIATNRVLSPVEIRFLLEEKFPDLMPKGIATQLIGLMPGSKDANWRDSDWGNAGAIFAADMNVSLAPFSIRNIENMIARVQKLEDPGFDVRRLAQDNKFTKLSDYLTEKDGIGFSQANEAWSTAIEHFTVHLDANELRDSYRKYFVESEFSDHNAKRIEKNQFLLTINIGEDKGGKPVTMQDFLDGETPEWLEHGIAFTSIGLDKKVMHTDEIYSLMYDDLKPEDLHRILHTIFAPYPIGLWNDDVGLFIAHAFLLEHRQIRQYFEKDEYHSQNVIWSKTMGELATGLIRQMRKQGHVEDILLLKEKLKKVVRVDLNVGSLREQEVWTWIPGKNGRMVPSIFAIEGVGEGQPSGEPQLWGLSALLMEPEYQEALEEVVQEDLHERLGSERLKQIFGEDAPGYVLDVPGRQIRLHGLNELLRFLEEGTDATRALQNGVLPYVKGLITNDGTKPSLIAGLLGHIKTPGELQSFLETIGAKPANAAMATSNPGGIDLNPAMMHLQAQGDDPNLGFSDAADSVMQVNGLTPIIIRIKQMSSPLFSD